MYELSHVNSTAVRQRVVDNVCVEYTFFSSLRYARAYRRLSLIYLSKQFPCHFQFNKVDNGIADYVARNVGVNSPSPDPAYPNNGAYSKFLSEILISANDTIETRKIAILVAGPVDEASINTLTDALKAGGARWDVIGPTLGKIEGTQVSADKTFKTAFSVMYDGVYVPGGGNGEALSKIGAAKEFV